MDASGIITINGVRCDPLTPLTQEQRDAALFGNGFGHGFAFGNGIDDPYLGSIDSIQAMRSAKTFAVPNTFDGTNANGSTGQIGAGDLVLIETLRCRSGANTPTYVSVLHISGSRVAVIPSFNSTPGRAVQAASASLDPVVVGAAESDGAANHPYHAFLYDIPTDRIQDLGTLRGPAGQSAATAVSEDGTVVVGTSETTRVSVPGPVVDGIDTALYFSHAFRWTAGTGMVDIDSSNAFGSSATDTNDAGSIVVGARQTVFGQGDRAYRWALTDANTGAGTFTDLGLPAGLASGYSRATNVSADGSVVAGYAGSRNTGAIAFRWTQAGGIVSLGSLAGFDNSRPQAVSADGNIIVGTAQRVFDPSQVGSADRAFRWTQAGGMQDLNVVVTNAGLSLSNNGFVLTLSSASSITRDGQFIAGTAYIFNPTTGRGATGTSSPDPVAYVIRYVDAATGSAVASRFASQADLGGTIAPIPDPPPMVGLSTFASQQASITGVAEAGRTLMAQQHGLGALLLGDNLPVKGPSEIGLFGAVGSLAGGASGRKELKGGITIMGAIAGNEADYGTAHIRDAVSIGLTARLAIDTDSNLMPFAQFGGWYTFNARYRFDRSYLNGMGTVTTRGNSGGEIFYAFARAGLAVEVGSDRELVFSGEVGREGLNASSYAEDTSSANPFPAVIGGLRQRLTVGKLRIAWTQGFTAKTAVTLWASGARVLSSSGVVAADVLGFGPFAGSASRRDWLEFGARIGTMLSDRVGVDAFTDGVATGNGPAHAHFGGTLRYRF